MVQNNETPDPSEVPETKRRGRPRKFNEALVLERVRDVFWNNGYAATSLDDLVAATGLNRPSLYASFGDKHALYMSALKANRGASVDAVRERLNRDLPLRQVLFDFLTEASASTLMGDAGARGCFIVCSAVTESLRDADARVVAGAYVTDLDAVFEERFRRSPGELHDGVNPASAAAVATAMLHTLAVRARTGSSYAELVRVAQSAVDLICGPGPL